MNFSFIAAFSLSNLRKRTNRNYKLSKLRKRISNPTPWTREDDHLLSLLRGINLPWPAIAKVFPNRTQNACEKHYCYLSENKKLTRKAALEKIHQLPLNLKGRIFNLFNQRKTPVSVQISAAQRLPTVLEFPPDADKQPPVAEEPSFDDDKEPSFDDDEEPSFDDDEQLFVDNEQSSVAELIAEGKCLVCGTDCCPFFEKIKDFARHHSRDGNRSWGGKPDSNR
ncbi:MAG: SANT/Myb domain-containing protein [Puniceicoccales bacterium]|nr:SANT/Myb domain-containing protein [Puniceicoccales bacterium]